VALPKLAAQFGTGGGPPGTMLDTELLPGVIVTAVGQIFCAFRVEFTKSKPIIKVDMFFILRYLKI